MARPIATVNPATGETVKTFTPLTPPEIEAKLTLAHQTFLDFRQTPLPQRAQRLHRAADLLEQNRTQYAHLITLEMGKTLRSAVAEVEKSAAGCRFYAEHAQAFLADVPAPLPGRAFVRYQPLGPILAVMPWNFPFWQVFRFAAPALMAGNVGLLKHASNVPQCALAIEAIFREAGFPPGAFQTLLIGAEQVAQVVADDRIQAATLTGSEPAGRNLARLAGDHLKKTVLELGGSDPFIVLPSADLEAALRWAVIARTMNNGQSCIAAKRFILSEAIADTFIEGMAERFRGLKVGDPMDPNTDLGPLATPEILEALDQQVQDSVRAGARLVVGGYRWPDRPGNFYPPTVLTDIPPTNRAYHEELFGPVAAVFRVKNLEEAIQLANDTNFGLGASAWTCDPDEQERLIEHLEAGSVFINGIVKSDLRLPFGGIKHSGYGRELSIQGIHEFVNVKTVWVQ
ncbi:NAD-dependent succinate-semialdehyde dehydrogenase [Anthocerotibacter panamensis]|uniref:NAD-dependent succinate-semialdehyde dehydrogenase n=1 Tax=Anthocerotibacter panamensis TaxID=2857077 RepID=UPI001C40757C|nr:NAD-dependent succinate-semialdehyde dehydrogenase [Anthocerotibacter panamensis]